MARRATTALTTLVVAILLALCVPVSQLRTVAVKQACCCPDPTHCHCPDHDAKKGTQSELRSCHRSQQVTVAPTLPMFTEPVVTVAIAPVIPVAAPLHEIHEPHAAPAPVRPDAPS